MDFDFCERLSWFDTNHYSYDKKVKVVENNEDGRAEVDFKSEEILFKISCSEKNRLEYLKQRKVADASIFKFTDEDKVDLHVVECKKTLRDSDWAKAKKQFEGGLINSYGVCGILGKRINNIFFYTAYREERLSYTNTANPVLLKNTLGNKDLTSAIDWGRGRVSIIDRQFEHRKIKLDESGYGEYRL